VKLPADLPNTPGFEFIGIFRDESKKFRMIERLCIVQLNALGCRSAYDLDGVPIYQQLIGWRPRRYMCEGERK